MYLRYIFLSNHNIHKSLYGLYIWASDPLIDRFYKNLLTKGFEAQIQRPYELLWMLWFDKKIYLVLLYTSPGWKIQKMVKKSWLSLKKMCIWCEKFKKNLGSIGGSLEEPQPKHVHWGLALRFFHCMSFARQFADLKNFTRYV